jgi:predicted MFS family arabinose efflux permease
LRSRWGIALLAATAGLAVASNYYVQPLLPLIARDLRGQAYAPAGLLVTVSQLGYLTGLLLLVPLGDLIDRRRLASGLMAATGVILLSTSAAGSLWWLITCLATLGTTSVVTQVAVTIAADVAEPAKRGRTVGTVASGALLGVLLARTASGAIAQIVGWRSVYVTSGALVLALAAGLAWRLPDLPPRQRISYHQQFRVAASLLRHSDVVRRSCFYGGATFAAFGLLWATLSPMLAGDPYHYSEGTIGLFGLAAAAGALGAVRGGSWFDRGHGERVGIVAMLLGIVAFGLIAAGRSSLAGLLLGIVLLDFACQLVQVTNQGAIYRLDEARSRLTSVYMVSRFAGGVIGSALGSVVFASAGWVASSAVGAAFFGAALAVAISTDGPRRLRRGVVDRDPEHRAQPPRAPAQPPANARSARPIRSATRRPAP